MPKTKKTDLSAWGPETTEAREGRACKQQHSSRAGSATSSGESDGGFPFPSALHSTHDGGAIHHCGRTNRCYWLIPARIDRNGTSIKRSKTDQCGRGVTLSVNASHGITCPVKAMLEFLQVRPSITGPLFCHFSGKPLTRYQFSAVLAKVLAQSSIDSVNKVWVIGSSIVKRASIASRERKGGLKLGIVNTEIWWQGYGGMVLSQLLPKLRVLRRIENDTDVLIIHCGANSLGLIELKSLLEKLQDTLEQIAKLFPRSKLVWSNLLPRFNWRYSEDIRAMEDSRKRVNREAILLREKKMSKLWPLMTICVEVLPPSLMVFGPPIVAVAVP
uniref:SGNH hydrolase-type esterase domain-containing protein n=1 Tax=Magallana gigas TaxID=29159 RepID=A0A8W8NC18_MAGGI